MPAIDPRAGLALREVLPQAQQFRGEIRVTSLATDLEQIRPGDLFVAIDHGNIDGHDLAEEALARGASAVLAERLLPHLNEKLRPTILSMKPGTRVVSNTFEIGGWRPDRVESVREECDYFFCKALLWIVPAQVNGNWVIESGRSRGALSLKQEFQNFTGTLNADGVSAGITQGRLNGDEITFSAGGVDYSGKVTGPSIEGTTKTGERWSAKRGG